MPIEHRVKCIVCGASHPVPASAVGKPHAVPQHLPQSWWFGSSGGMFWAACSTKCQKRITPELVRERHEARVRAARSRR